MPPGTAKVSANPGEVKHEDDQQSQDGTRVLDGFLDEGGPELKAQLTLDPQGSDDFLMAEIEAGEDQNGNLTGILRGFTESGLTHMAIMT